MNGAVSAEKVQQSLPKEDKADTDTAIEVEKADVDDTAEKNEEVDGGGLMRSALVEDGSDEDEVAGKCREAREEVWEQKDSADQEDVKGKGKQKSGGVRSKSPGSSQNLSYICIFVVHLNQ